MRDLGRSKGIEIGAAYSGHSDPRYRSLLASQVGLITPEWCLKPGFLQPTRDAPYRFALADETYAYARKAGLSVHGHTLFWHGDPLTWVGDGSTSEALSAYRALAKATMSRYADTVSWDVANEVVSDPGEAWRAQAGFKNPVEAVATLFRDAAAHAPGRLLCINDYNLECGASWCDAKRQRMLGIIDELQARQVPLKVVGLQGHLSSRYGLSLGATLSFVRQLADRGLDVHLSELDVNDILYPDEPGQRDEQVAKLYGRYLTAMLSERSVTRVTFWGLTDFDHWMVRDQTDDARPAGQARPALFDRELRPKAAFWEVAACLERAPSRASRG